MCLKICSQDRSKYSTLWRLWGGGWSRGTVVGLDSTHPSKLTRVDNKSDDPNVQVDPSQGTTSAQGKYQGEVSAVQANVSLIECQHRAQVPTNGSGLECSLEPRQRLACCSKINQLKSSNFFLPKSLEARESCYYSRLLKYCVYAIYTL